MSDFFHPSLGPLHGGQQFTLDRVQYPAGWLQDASKRAALGVVTLRREARPDDRFYQVTELPPVVQGDEAVITFQVTPRDVDALKAQAIVQIKASAGALLAPTDWRVVRAAEGIKPLDAATAAHRAAIRATSDAAELAIAACTTVEDLAALPPVEWPVA